MTVPREFPGNYPAEFVDWYRKNAGAVKVARIAAVLYAPAGQQNSILWAVRRAIELIYESWKTSKTKSED